MDLSIVIPVYNELGNVTRLYNRIRHTIPSKLTYEIIYVDDGSIDGTYEELLKLRGITIIRFRKNFGQTAALAAGFDHAKGAVVVSIDGDCQNDPADIPRLLEKLEEGYDVVSGWRWHRRDGLGKRIMSLFANRLRSLLISDPVRDSGCTLKAYKREVLQDLELYGEMHRYIPSLLKWKGYSIGELKVRHQPRRQGTTKYDWKRLLKGFLDLLNVLFWRKFATRPLHIFGGFGLFLMIVGGLFLAALIVLRLLKLIFLGNSTMPLLAVFLVILGVQFFVSGLIADIMVKTYHEVNNKKIYFIKEIKNT